MTQPTRTEAISRFLQAKAYADLANMYNFYMECQVNVAQGEGTRLDKTYKGRTFMTWTDGLEEWKSFRIPRNAGTKAEYTDSPMNYNFEKHVEAIGMTGWDWRGFSRWVAFDFDAITGHSDRHVRKSSDQELKQIEELVKSIPWVTLRYSKSGKGLHLYVYLPSVPTANHNEHAALARSILGQLSGTVGYDFSSKVDVCGGNMWVWHRNMRDPGFCLIKGGEILRDIPSNWRDHVPVVKGDRRQTLPSLIKNQSEEDAFEAMTSRETKIDLDKEHRTLIEWLGNNGAYWWWDSDRNMLVTHTFFLQQAHEDLGLRGVFRTISQGTERGTDHNCFASPLRMGAWAVRRFSPGVAEDPTWTQDGAGWTKCYLNREPDLQTTARSFGGKEQAKGGYQFPDAKAGQDAVIKLGGEISLPANMLDRRAVLKSHKEQRKVVMEVERREDDTGKGMEEWIANKKTWERVIPLKFVAPPEPDAPNFDDQIRHVITEEVDAGWVMSSDSKRFYEEPLQHIKLAMKSLGHKTADIDVVLGTSVLNPWQLVNLPFGPEYPGNREWNRNAAQLRFKPTKDKDPLEYPTWQRIFDHLGQGLDMDVADHPWCKKFGILTGSDYLKVWVASMLQFPFEQLPYLFFYSEAQNTGKSTLREALSLCITRGGVVEANNALISEQKFNGELANAVLCYVEEMDLSRGKGKALAYNRIKDWVTAKTFQVHIKNLTPYQIPNTTHWMQTANTATSCPIFPGDTRITMIQVEEIPAKDMIGKSALLELLTKEAPDFLAAMLSLEIPPTNERLNVPVISTSSKELVQASNRTIIEEYMAEECYQVDGEIIKFSEFRERFTNWLRANGDQDEYTSHQVRDLLPSSVVYGKSAKDNQRYIANWSFSPPPPLEKAKSAIYIHNGSLQSTRGLI